ncbi:trypsin alpha-4-like [Ornithodoros turicata]|uniref:trypsin alpha-4-like n=1 Tax=Ornithodoros turicata TaxID=34597 RepID=UPI00313902EC
MLQACEVCVLAIALYFSAVADAQCGQSNSTGARIVGGRNATPGEFPWQVSIQMKRGNFHFCGGSIIEPDIIVTAAHCMERPNPSDIRIQAGFIDLKNPGPSVQQRDVAQIKVHEDYDPVVNDIALIRLTEPFDFAAADGLIGPVCLPSKGYNIQGNMVATGWGTTLPGGRSSSVLLAVSVPVRQDTTCSMGTFWSYEKDSMVCAGEFTKDSCQGDSGGPAVQTQNGQTVLTGIVSYGVSCGVFPGVYTRVPSYVDWISSNIASLRRDPSMFKVIAGTLRKKPPLDETAQTRQAVASVVHEDYVGRGRLSNDIAILKVDPPFDFEGSNGYIGPVCLPPDDLCIEKLTVISGYGSVRAGGPTPDELLTASVPVISDEECEKIYKEAFNNVGQPNAFDDETMYCAAERGAKDSCQGDSGGPAVQRLNGAAILTGVVSWGIGCAHEKYPGVYTEVPLYVDWIREHANVTNPSTTTTTEPASSSDSN